MRGAVALAVLAALGLLVPGAPSQAEAPQGCPAHSPILIRNETDLRADPARHGIVSGNGTADDPFRIACWRIESRASHLLGIFGTRSHIRIENVTAFTDATREDHGVFEFHGVQNVTLVDSDATGPRDALQVGTSQMVVRNLTVRSSWGPCVNIQHSRVELDRLRPAACSRGITLRDGAVEIRSSNLSNTGIDSMRGRVLLDAVRMELHCMEHRMSGELWIRNSTFSRCMMNALTIDGEASARVEDSQVLGGMTGILVYGGGLEISRTFFGGNMGAVYASGDGPPVHIKESAFHGNQVNVAAHGRHVEVRGSWWSGGTFEGRQYIEGDDSLDESPIPFPTEPYPIHRRDGFLAGIPGPGPVWLLAALAAIGIGSARSRRRP